MRQTFLMCRPTFYGVEYEINPWMQDNIGYVDKALAMTQWESLYNQLSQFANIELIEPVEGLPDMVFTANAAMIDFDDSRVWLSKFANEQRRGEEFVFARWFIEQGFAVSRSGSTLPGLRGISSSFFEGAGDGLVDSDGTYWLGYGMRSTKDAVEYFERMFIEYVEKTNRKRAILMEMVSPWFYHLDTCFCPLSNGEYLIYPEAFATLDHVSQYSDKFIVVSEQDANLFACNAVCVDNNIIMPLCSDELVQALEARGYNVYPLDFSEFLKAGGAAKCLTLRLY